MVKRRSERLTEFLRGMDTNGNGMIDADEAAGGQQLLLERIIGGEGLEVKYPLSINQVRDSLMKSYQALVPSAGPDRPATASPPANGESHASEPPRPSGPEPRPGASPAGSGPSVGSAKAVPPLTAPGESGRSAAGPEPSKPASSAAFSTVASSHQVRSGAAGSATTGNPGPSAVGSTASHPSTPARKSNRFLTAAERLPEGLPDWFTDKDEDGDGQVSMAEFASDWTPQKAAEFSRYDLNGDGLITAQECLKVVKASQRQ
jgi:hypothetical protein